MGKVAPRLDLELAAAHLEDAAPQDVLAWAVESFSPGLSLACSFGMQSVALIDMLHRGGLLGDVEVFYLDTGVLFDETHDTRRALEERYGLRAVRVTPELTIAEQARVHGESLWEHDADACCRLRKVEPLRRYLAGKLAWVTGMRRAHHNGRGHIPVVLWDGVNGLAKVNPLAHWDDRALWRYIHTHGVPYNALYDQGYPSIGCVPCTRPVAPGEDPRAGRWAGRNKTECGIHVEGSAVRSLNVVR